MAIKEPEEVVLSPAESALVRSTRFMIGAWSMDMYLESLDWSNEAVLMASTDVVANRLAAKILDQKYGPVPPQFQPRSLRGRR